nr:DUF6147 family protein [uncultured Mediterraneibacter sp.]
MKRRVISLLTSCLLLAGMLTVSSHVDINALENNSIDGSYLTENESSVGKTADNDLERGVHLMDGECSISKAGTKRIYTYGATTANHTVDYLAVIVYVDRYNEENDRWDQIDVWAKEGKEDYFICTSKSITVDRGYYYRVHADHIVEKDGVYEETASLTNGILVPK